MMTEQQPVCKWSYHTKGRLGRTSPTIAQDGTVYVGDQECHFYAISSEGKLVWRRSTAGRLGDSTASVTDDGVILIASETGRLHAFSHAGDILWRSNLNWLAVTSPVTTRGGSVIFGARKQNEPAGQHNRLMALDRWGNPIWEATIQGDVSDAPAISTDGTIYLGTDRSYLYAVTPGGDIKWQYRPGGRISSAPAMTRDGLVLVGTHDGYLYAISAEMEMAWKYPTEEIISQSSPAIAADGTIYFGSWDRCLYALSPEGRLKWKFVTERPISSSPAVAADGTIYFGSQDARYYALWPDGSLRWKLRTDSPVVSSPAITEEGVAVLCTHNRSILALDEQNGGPAPSGWPMLLGGAQRSGRHAGHAALKRRPEYIVANLAEGGPPTTLHPGACERANDQNGGRGDLMEGVNLTQQAVERYLNPYLVCHLVGKRVRQMSAHQSGTKEYQALIRRALTEAIAGKMPFEWNGRATSLGTAHARDEAEPKQTAAVAHSAEVIAASLGRGALFEAEESSAGAEESKRSQTKTALPLKVRVARP